MGLSPYIAHPEIDAAMDRIAAKISESMLSDLCDATNLGTFNRAVDLTGAIAKAFAKAKTIHINKLLAAQKPADTRLALMSGVTMQQMLLAKRLVSRMTIRLARRLSLSGFK